MRIIGLSGYARSGKDEAAKVLVEEYGFIRIAFADKLREVLYALNPAVAPSKEHDGVVHLREVIDVYTWNGYKETAFGPEIRRLLQRLGTEAGRETLWDSIWVDAAFANVPDDAKVVVTDCRFANEASAIVDKGGEIWRISRFGIGPAVGENGVVHKSETSLDGWDFDRVITNDGTLEEFHNKIRTMVVL